MNKPTPEQISRSYSAALDSVNLIDILKARVTLTDEEVLRLAANIEHIKIMLQKDYWTVENLLPLQDAVA